MFRPQALGLSLTLLLAAVPAWCQVLPISSGDKLDVVVAGETQLSRVYTVDQDGNIIMDLVGKVPVKDLAPAQVRDELMKRLGRFIKEPQISVDFKERAQISVNITGEVGKPGQLQLPKGKRLLDGIGMAEGVKAVNADTRNVRFQRRGESAPRVLDLSRILERDAGLNLELMDGDSIYVPPVPTYSIQVLGAVNKPDLFIRKERMRLLDAVLAAGGFTVDANRSRVELMRKSSSQAETYNLENLLSGKDGNPLIEDGDVVSVPEYRKVHVKVYGSVAKPGIVQVREGTGVQALIAEVGGFAADANKTAVTLKPVSGEAKQLNLQEVNSPDGATPAPDGAELQVPQLQRFAVTGGVAKPEVYPLPNDGKNKVYLSDALALAGGPIDRAKKKHVYLIRKAGSAKPEVQEFNLESYLKTKDPALNPEIQANDVIFIDATPDLQRKEGFAEKIAPFLRILPLGF